MANELEDLREQVKQLSERVDTLTIAKLSLARNLGAVLKLPFQATANSHVISRGFLALKEARDPDNWTKTE